MPRKTSGNIRKRFSIKGKEWRVEYVYNLAHPERGPCLGDCDPDTRTIKIERQQKPEAKFRTFIYELFRAIHYESHATEAGGVHGILGEVLAESCTDVLLDLFTVDWRGRRLGARGPRKKAE